MKVVTHNGQFHADEVVACMMLRKLYYPLEIIRTRNPEEIESADIVVDVGGIYDPKNNRFDHHQAGCKEFLSSEHNIPLSSAGMVYKEMGRDFIKCFHQFDDNEDLEAVYHSFYLSFIQEIDAIDNGVKQTDGWLEYRVCTSLSTVINRLNYHQIYNKEMQMGHFTKGMDYAQDTASIILKSIYERRMQYKIDYQTIKEAFEERLDVDLSGQILVIKKDCSNWQKCLMDIEKEVGLSGDSEIIKFVIYRSSKEWRVRTISCNFVSRKNLLPKYELEKRITNPLEIEFVHNKLFIASATTFETALEIAKESLQ